MIKVYLDEEIFLDRIRQFGRRKWSWHYFRL